MDEYRVLKTVNFDWTMQLQSVWRNSPLHVPGLHENVRAELMETLKERMGNQDQNPLGQIITGPAGAGKTHLLSAMRQEVAALPAWFVLVDMTDIKDFWETVLLGYLNSLQQAALGKQPQFRSLLKHLLNPDSKPQNSFSTFYRTPSQPKKSLLQWLIAPLAGKKTRCQEAAPATPRQIAEYGDKELVQVIRQTINRLSTQYPEEIRAHQDALRALILLNSNDLERANVGYSWLQGMPIDETDRHLFGFLWPQRQPSEIVKSLSWLMSRYAPTLLAFDQLDAIMSQYHITASAGEGEQITGEQRASQAIIEGVADGFMAVRDTVYRTATVLACLEASWEILRKGSLSSATDRFASPQPLPPINNATLAEEIITLRLAHAYRTHGFTPPYPSWPFQPEFFTSAATLLPRELLKRCEEHRLQCLSKGKGKVMELACIEAPPESTETLATARPDPDPDPDLELDQSYQEFCRQAPIQALLSEEAEDEVLGALIPTLCRCLLREAPPPENRQGVVDTEFPGDKNYRALHARLRIIDSSQENREQHYCFRALQKTHATAYQNRLNGALTASGIDPRLPFRRLIIVRTTPLPLGKVTREITDKFLQAKGKFAAPNEQDLRTMWALHKLEQQNLPGFEAWLRQRRPATQLQWLQETEITECLVADAFPLKNNPPLDTKESTDIWTNLPALKRYNYKTTAPLYPSALPVGQTLSNPAEKMTIPLPLLAQYTGVLAGSGSGKTVLLKRWVEEAALLGIPSIVIDRTHTLASLGKQWPIPPAIWTSEDQEKAERYHANTEVIIWTPGQTDGNPLPLEPLPDLASLLEQSEKFQQALEMAQSTLKEIVAPGKSAHSEYKMDVLTAALKLFAIQKGKTLPDLIAILSHLPAEISTSISSATRLGSEMAQRLQAEIQNNRLFYPETPFLDPGCLFKGTSANRTRISIINLAGLPDLKTQQQFLNQLAITLLGWIKQHSASPSMPVQGFLILDEAEDFIPADTSTPCKDNLLKLADYAPTGGLGLVFSTQNPKNIASPIVSDCFTQFFGKASAPATIEAIREQFKMRGDKEDDIPTLEAGHFYLHTEGMPAPVKVAVPWCLSYHPPHPPGKDEVLKRAAASRLHAKDP
ncbi:ATPase AAA [Nitrosococcus watsonii]|uniref:ATPase-like protein n=1 Tax=Nitrosococcus watsoni (strain C-113) TaxID=105559 RepID=D8KBB1_NITWC|nr:ATPase AAA [Nitrosococcus watsonii]ADJ29558.1 ATPase-like protein [Nitrosococcus watsonii C-113]